MRKHTSALAVFVMLFVVFPLAAQAPSQADLYGIYQIKDEGFNHSQVMDIMSYLSDVYGPRLTNSPDIKEAAAWTTGKMLPHRSARSGVRVGAQHAMPARRKLFYQFANRDDRVWHHASTRRASRGGHRAKWFSPPCPGIP